MKEKYEPLFQTLTLPNGVELDNRFVVSPVITQSSTREGYVTDADCAYAERRAHSAAMMITGAAYVEPYGQLFKYGFSVTDDRHIPGLSRLSQAMKSQGNKAVLQLTHAGRFAEIALQDYSVVYGPSRLDLNTPIKHTVYPMSKRKIRQVVKQYGDATRRAIKAGFDGVEISAAQRLLIQTFFSKFSNQREDQYGPQTLENRMRLGLEIFEEVQKVIDEEKAGPGFILGFRGTPEEARGNQIGYTVEEFNHFVDEIMRVADIDYYATASWGKNIYAQKIRAGQYQGEYMNKIVHNHFKNRLPIMATGGINSPEKALEAMQFSDFVGASTPFVTEPEFVVKIAESRENEIDMGISEEKISDLKIPDRAFADIVYMMDLGGSLSEETRNSIRQLDQESNQN